MSEKVLNRNCPLNECQRQLIDDYLATFGWKHIIKCLNKVLKKPLTEEELEEWIGYICAFPLVKAARNYKPGKQMKFSSFVEMNVINDIYSEIRRRTAKKNKYDGEFIYLDDTPYDSDNGCATRTFGDIIEDERNKNNGNTSRIRAYLNTLSPLKKDILIFKLLGFSETEIIEELDFKENKEKFYRIKSDMARNEYKNILRGVGRFKNE